MLPDLSLTRLPQSDSSEEESSSESSSSSRVALEKRLASWLTVWTWGLAPDEDRVGEKAGAMGEVGDSHSEVRIFADSWGFCGLGCLI